MTITNLSNSPQSERHPLLTNLQEKLLGSSPDQHILEIRTWKNDLINQDPISIVHLVLNITQSDDKYIIETLVPEIFNSLDKNTVRSLLFFIQNEYANKIPEQKQGSNIADLAKVEPIDDFTQKKSRIRNKLSKMYADKMLDGKFIFGLAFFLMHENKNTYPEFAAGTFWEDIQKWLFTGENVESSFWDRVTNPAPEMQATTEITTHSIKDTMTQASS